MSISQIELYDLLKNKLGEREAKALVQFVSEQVSTAFLDEKSTLATKDDVKTLEIKIESGFKDQLKWIIVLLIGFSSLIITLVKFLPLVQV